MTDSNYTAVVLIVDRSGSMSSLASTVEETLKEFVGAQVAEPGRLTIDTVFFDDKIEHRASFVDPAKETLDLKLDPRGMTALFDAVGSKIESFGKALAKLPEKKRPGKVIFVIATDGHENSSSDYSQAKVAELIGLQKDTYSWDFTFIGANQDAVLTAQALNINPGSAITFDASAEGTENVLRSMSAYVTGVRGGQATSYSAEDRAAAAGLSDALRQDPSNIAVGDVRATSSARGAATPPKPKRAPRAKKAAPKDEPEKS